MSYFLIFLSILVQSGHISVSIILGAFMMQGFSSQKKFSKVVSKVYYSKLELRKYRFFLLKRDIARD